MKKKSLKVFNRLENQRGEIINMYNELAEDQLRFSPGPQEWSLLQVMRHLVTSEKQSMIYIQRKMGNQEEVPITGIDSTIRHLILKVALILPLKFKAPKIAQVSEEHPDFDSMKMEWDSIRDEMRSLIKNSDDKTLGKALYKHPRAGLLNIKQALKFIETHTAHHQKQMERIKKHLSFPVNP